MTIKFHSQIGEAAFSDLRRLLQDESVSDLRGTPTLVTVKAKKFWYDKYRIGTDVRQRYIGPDTDELRQRLDNAKALKAEAEYRKQERVRLIRILRAEGYVSTDRTTGSLLDAFAKAGVFRLGGTLIGTVAFKLYEGELGVSLGFDRMAQTDDVDIASFERLSFAVDDAVETPLADVFRELNFSPLPAMDKNAVWRWAQSRAGTQVEFLMPAKKEESVRPLPALGVSAMALRHLDYLLEAPIKTVALYRSGILLQVPRPEAFAIHKLIVSERRHGGADTQKARKDRMQASFLIHVLSELRPDELLLAYNDALARGKRWQELIAKSLEKLPAEKNTLSQLSE